MGMNEAGSEVAQMERIARIETPPAKFPVDLRLTIPFYPKPIFVALIMGREKRGPERLHEERLRHPLEGWGNIVCAFFLGCASTVPLMFAFLLVHKFLS